MKEQLIKLAKEKEFKSKIVLTITILEKLIGLDLFYYLWLCELQKWLREKHNLEVNSESVQTNRLSLKWGVYVKDLNHTFNELGYGIKYDSDNFVTHKEALEEGLKQALELIK